MLPTIRLLDNKPSEWLAHRFFVLAQYDMCLNVVNQILRKTPDNAEALSLKGSVLRTKGQIEEALNCFQTASSLDAHNIRHQLEIAKCLYFLGRFQQSLSLLQEIEETDEGKIWEVYHLIGENNAKLRKYDDAIDAFDNAIDADFRIESIMEELSVFEAQKDYKSMKSLINEALSKHPSNAVLRRRVGKFYLSSSQYNEALSQFQYAYNRDKQDYQSMLLAGSIEQEEQHPEKAIRLYRRAYIGLSTSPALWNNVSMCITARNKTEAAVSCCKKAVFCAPFEAVPLSNLGLNYLEMGLYCSAAVALKRALALDPNCEDAGEGLGIALMNLGQYEQAAKAFIKEIHKGKTHRLLINTAICMYKSKKYKEAKTLFESFRKIVEDEPAYLSLYPYDNILLPLFSNLPVSATPTKSSRQSSTEQLQAPNRAPTPPAPPETQAEQQKPPPSPQPPSAPKRTRRSKPQPAVQAEAQ